MRQRLLLACFFLVLLGALLPREAKALPVTDSVVTSLTTGSTPATSDHTLTFPIIGTPGGTIFWLAELFGDCSDGNFLFANGCSLSPDALSPALSRFDIDGVTLADLGTPLTFSGRGPNTFGFAASGSFDCTTVAGCNEMHLRTDFIGSETGIFNVTQRLTLSEAPLSVPEPSSLLLFGAGLLGLPIVRRKF